MITTDALKRLAFTIGKENKPNHTDKVALNSIIKFINLSDKKAVQENVLFAKLYIYLLKEFLVHYNYDIDFANKQLNRELMMPLNVHVELLTNYLKSGELSRFFKEKGLQDAFYTDKPYSEQIAIHRENKAKLKEVDVKECIEAYEFWDKNNVEAQLNRIINEALTQYKND